MSLNLTKYADYGLEAQIKADLAELDGSRSIIQSVSIAISCTSDVPVSVFSFIGLTALADYLMQMRLQLVDTNAAGNMAYTIGPVIPDQTAYIDDSGASNAFNPIAISLSVLSGTPISDLGEAGLLGGCSIVFIGNISMGAATTLTCTLKQGVTNALKAVRMSGFISLQKV